MERRLPSTVATKGTVYREVFLSGEDIQVKVRFLEKAKVRVKARVATLEEKA